MTEIPSKTPSIIEASSLLPGSSKSPDTSTTFESLTLEDGKINEDKIITKSETLRERILHTLDYIHSKLFARMPRRLIVVLIFIDLLFLFLRFLCHAYGLPTFSRIFLLLFIELAMLMVSTYMYKRFVGVIPRKKSNDLKHARIFMTLFALTWIILAHSCWIWFYVPIPDDFFVSIMGFLALGAYIHCAVLCFFFFFVERISHLVAPKLESTLLKSETLHTIVAIVFALLLASHGFMVTSGKPLVRNINIYIKDLPQEFDGFSIALMTDIHIGPTVGKSRMTTAVQVANQLQPDLVAIVGDMVDGYVSYLRPRAKPLADLRSKHGTFFVTGNHEYMHENVDNWLDFFKNELNITSLRNRGIILKNKDKELCLAGVDDIFTEKIHVAGHLMDVKKALNDCPSNVPTVLLAHQPNGASRILKVITETKQRVDLILSGHTHGGQMFVVWPLSFLGNRFFYGLYNYPTTGTQIYVSSGVNYWGPPIKMPNLCEVVNIRLHRSASEDLVDEPIQ